MGAAAAGTPGDDDAQHAPTQAADELRPYLDAGFTGFTFNNNVYPRPEQIAAIGELLRLVA